jgi:Protein of unknown function (DUF2523)
MPDSTPITNPTPEPLPIVDNPEATGIFDWITDLLKSFGLTIWDMLKDLLLFIVDIFMDLGFLILEGFQDVMKLIDLSQYLSGIPSEVSFVLSATGLSQAIGMIMLAGTARLLMQLIPFVRLGS